MKFDFSDGKCQTTSSRKKFGLCDDLLPIASPAYIDEMDGSKWIVVVVNEERHDVMFTAIDNCITIKRIDGRLAKRCDGALTYKSTIIFVELKTISTEGSNWVKDAEKQLRETVPHFEQEDDARIYNQKKVISQMQSVPNSK